MTLFQAAAEIAEFLEEHGVNYAILGGLAVQYWGEPRATHDVDITVMVPQEQLERFVEQILQKFRPRLPDASTFALRHRVLLVEASSGVPIDISLGIPGYEEEVLRRSVRVHLPDVRSLQFISAEDLIVHKCVAGRARDQEDVERILVRQRLQVDLAYIRRWLQDFAPLVSTHGVQSVFEEALRKAGRALGENQS